MENQTLERDERGEIQEEMEKKGNEEREERGEIQEEMEKERKEEMEKERGEIQEEMEKEGNEEMEKERGEILEEMEKEGKEESEEEQTEEKGEENPTHLPFAPDSSELLDDDSTTVDPSYIISLIRKLLPSQLKDGEKNDQENELKQEFEEGIKGENEEKLEKKDQWEESGCILWDLAASKTQAEFMVENFLLEVLLANLHSSESFRIKEICLGIIGNLACHDTVIQKITSQKDLIETIVQQLFLDDSPCLTETFRVLEVGVKSSEYSSFAESLSSNEMLERILWIFGNTLNLSLLEKCVDFLLAVIGSEELGNILLQPLIKLGLNNISVNLFMSEINKSGDENNLERSDILDVLINLIEALSALDGFLENISSEKMVQYFCNTLKNPAKFEDSSYNASAVLIIANVLAENKKLVSDLLHDIPLLEGLFLALPLLPNDPQPKNALWCIISTLLVEINENNKLSDLASLDQLARVLLSKTEIIEDYVADQVRGNFKEDLARENYLKVYGVKTSLRRIGEIIGKWNEEKTERDNNDEIERVNRLLNCCSKCDEL